VQHGKECKGLVVQIKYLKAKWTRESLLRCDLGYQKQYLLVLLSSMEKRYTVVNLQVDAYSTSYTLLPHSEKRILASIAQIGFPAAPPQIKKRHRTLREAAFTIIFVQRAR
jgi:hypothetical protein